MRKRSRPDTLKRLHTGASCRELPLAYANRYPCLEFSISVSAKQGRPASRPCSLTRADLLPEREFLHPQVGCAPAGAQVHHALPWSVMHRPGYLPTPFVKRRPSQDDRRPNGSKYPTSVYRGPYIFVVDHGSPPSRRPLFHIISLVMLDAGAPAKGKASPRSRREGSYDNRGLSSRWLLGIFLPRGAFVP